MGQQINYKLQMNGGADNDDCLIIAEIYSNLVYGLECNQPCLGGV